MSDLDSPYYPEILALGGHAIPDASEYEQEVIGRRAFCFRKREERRKEMGFRPEAEQCLTKIPREEALRMLREKRRGSGGEAGDDKKWRRWRSRKIVWCRWRHRNN